MNSRAPTQGWLEAPKMVRVVLVLSCCWTHGHGKGLQQTGLILPDGDRADRGPVFPFPSTCMGSGKPKPSPWHKRVENKFPPLFPAPMIWSLSLSHQGARGVQDTSPRGWVPLRDTSMMSPGMAGHKTSCSSLPFPTPGLSLPRKL